MIYGAPYKGGKTRVAKRIIERLPAGKRMVDLFGGGGAITHCALIEGKWPKILYNDIEPMITELFINAARGMYKDEKRVITREDFYRLKDTDAYVKYAWSFGGDGKSYLWGEDEKYKCQVCRMLAADDLTVRRLEWRKLTRMQRPKTRLVDLKGLESLTRLNRIAESLSDIDLDAVLEVTNIDYREYKHVHGDIVYCDIPYEGTSNTYGTEFNVYEFYEWARTREYPLYFSSSEISEKGFERYEIAVVPDCIGTTTNSKHRQEFLYYNGK